jgi:NAD(P)-dependent dehydrogenase (short-subunit alcohol dehydrogenase family)
MAQTKQRLPPQGGACKVSPLKRFRSERERMAEADNKQAVSARFPDLAGKAAIVTGTSRGIGVGIAEFLGRQGMRLVTTARSAEAGEAVAERVRAAGADCVFVAADLATPEGAARVFEAATQRLGRIDLLVNNAANLRSKAFLDLDEEKYRQSFEANMRMIYGLSHLAARHMAEAPFDPAQGRGGGSIIHISSVGGLRAHRGAAGYDASKGAIDALTRAMAVDLAPHKIRVNAVAPGLTLTHDYDARWRDRPVPPHWAEMWKKKLEGIPLGRGGTPEDMAAAVAFLASDAGSYITGQVLYVDGGLTAQLTPPGIVI